MLEDRRFERLGGQKSVQVDFRLISATNRPLDQFVRDSRFREDLYYRVNAFSIRLPSLRERPVDIPVLASAGSSPATARPTACRSTPRLPPRSDGALQAYPWPGNIRELESTVSRAALSAPGRVIRDTDIEFLHAQATVDRRRAAAPADAGEAERAHIVRVLEAVGLEQEGSGARARDQPRHALPEDRRIRPRARSSRTSRNRHDRPSSAEIPSLFGLSACPASEHGADTAALLQSGSAVCADQVTENRVQFPHTSAPELYIDQSRRS